MQRDVVQEWWPDALPFLARFLEHQAASTLPSQGAPLPAVPAGAGFGTVGAATAALGPHILEEAVAGLKEEAQRDRGRPVTRRRCVVGATADSAFRARGAPGLRFATLRDGGSGSGGERPADWGEGTVVLARAAADRRRKAFGVVIAARERVLGLGDAKGAARLAFRAADAAVLGARGNDVDVEVAGDVLTAVREYQALASLPAVAPALRAPLLASAPRAAPAAPPATPKPLWAALERTHNASQFGAIRAACAARPSLGRRLLFPVSHERGREETSPSPS